MKRASWIALSASVIVLGAAAAGVAAYRHGGPGMMGRMRFEKLAVRLKLTPQQESQIKSDLKQARTNARPSIESMRNLRGAIAKQIFTDNPDQAAIQKNADQLKQQLSAMIDEYVKAGMQINSVLSPAQRAEMQKIISEHQELMARRRARWEQHQMQHRQHSGEQTAPGEPSEH